MRLCELCKFKVQSSEEKGNLPLKEKENFASMAMALTACFRPSFFWYFTLMPDKTTQAFNIWVWIFGEVFDISHCNVLCSKKVGSRDLFLAMSKRSFSAKGYGWKKSTKHDDPGNLDPTSTVMLLKVIYPPCSCCNLVQCPLIWHLPYSKLYLALPDKVNNNLAHMILLAQERRWPGRTTPNGEVMESPSTIPSWEALQTRLRQCLNWLRLFREWCAVLGGAVSANGYLTSTYTKANFLGIYFLFRGLLSHIARAVYLKRTISFLCSLGNHGTVGCWAGPWKLGDFDI